MKYPNAAKGIGRIFLAEIIDLFVIVLAFLMSLLIFLSEAGILNSSVAVAAAVVLMAAAAVMPLSSLIVLISGLRKASKDDELFKRALILTYIAAITQLIAVIASNTGIRFVAAGSISESVSRVIRAFSVFFVCGGISKLLKTAGYEEHANKANGIAILVAGGMILQIVGNFLTDYPDASVLVQNIHTGISVVSTLISFIGLIRYLSYLREAKTLLE